MSSRKIAIRLPDEVVDGLAAIADATGEPFSVVVRDVLAEYADTSTEDNEVALARAQRLAEALLDQLRRERDEAARLRAIAYPNRDGAQIASHTTH